MKLTDIIAKLTGLESRAQAADASLRAEVVALRTVVDGTLTKAEADATDANTKLSEALNEVATIKTERDNLFAASNAIREKLDSALTALNIKAGDNATQAEKIELLQGSVSSTLAKLSVDPAKIPAPAPAASAAQITPDKTMSRSQFTALTPFAQAAFCRAGGKVTE